MERKMGEEYFHESFEGLPASTRRGANYIWLMYSAFYFVEPIMRKSLRYWVECLAIFVAFLPLYVWYVETKHPRIRLPLVGVIALLGLVTIHFNTGASFFLIFAAALVPFTVGSMRSAVLLIGGEALCVAGDWLLGRNNPINFGVTIGMMFVVGLANVFIAEQKRAACRLAAAQQENAALAKVAERERIARDLHDVLGHTLSVIVLKAELAGRLMGRGTVEDGVRAAKEIAEVEKTARTALAEVREAIGGYRAKGLRAEVDMARMTLDAAGVVLHCETLPPVLKAREETALSLAVREAVTNIVRHAGATECTMRFAMAADGFASLEVEDNGNKAIEREGNGLRGMRARVEEVGGRFRIERAPVCGTRLVIELPGSALA